MFVNSDINVPTDLPFFQTIVAFSIVLQTYASCKEALPGDLNNGEYWIQHKNMQEPIKVNCKREAENVLAVFDHDSEKRTVVKGFEKPGSYR